MSKVCEKCGKGPKSGHNVSHSVRRTKRRFLPNLITKKLVNDEGAAKRVKICTRCLRTSSKVK